MLTSILYGFLIWFNVGLASHAIIMTFDGLLNRRWPYRWSDAYNYFLSAMFGFISAFNCYLFMVGFAIDPESFISDGEDGEETTAEQQEGMDENIMIIAGLTEEEQAKVQDLLHTIIESRPKEEKQNVE